MSVGVGVGDLNEDGVAGGIEYGFMSFTTDRGRVAEEETARKRRETEEAEHVFASSPVWGFVSFLPSFLPFHPEWPRTTPRSSAWRWATTACPRSSSTWTTSLGGWVFFGGLG